MKRGNATFYLSSVSLALLLVVGGAIVLDPGVAACDKGQGKGKRAEGACQGAGAGGGQGCCGGHGEEARGQGQGKAHGKGQGKGQGAAVGCGGQGGQGDHRENIHSLLDRHDAIERQVEEIPGGVETVTTSEDPEVVEILREHVGQMKERVENGQGMRWWDPTFAELFKFTDKIEMQIEEIPGGVRVREWSEDPQVAMLIRQHAIRGVSEFVEDGYDRAHQPTPLPEGYGVEEQDVQPAEEP